MSQLKLKQLKVRLKPTLRVFPTDIYLLNSTMEALEPCVKLAQS